MIEHTFDTLAASAPAVRQHPGAWPNLSERSDMADDNGLRAIPGFPGYAASADGGVWSLHGASPRLLKPYQNARGYLQYTLHPIGTGQQIIRTGHQLVAAAFFGLRTEGMETRHLNGDPSDNRAENLAYGTRLEDSADRTRHGRTPVGETHGMGRLTAEQVQDIRRRYYAGESSLELAATFGVAKQHVTRIVRGQSWNHLPWPDGLAPEPPNKGVVRNQFGTWAVAS